MKKDENIIWLLLPSFIGLSVSLISLVGLTLAWFKTNMPISSNPIVAANFDIAATITSSGTEITKTDGFYHLEPSSYEITLKRTGTSEMSQGYSLIQIGDYTYHSAPLEKGQPITFKLTIDTPHDIEFLPVWGTSELNDQNKIDDESSIEIILLPPVEDEIEEPIETQENLASEDILKSNDEEQKS